MPGLERRPRGRVVQGRHRLHGVVEDLARGLVAVVQHADPERLGQADRHPGDGGVVSQQAIRVAEAGHGHAVLRLGVVDAVAASHRAAGLPRHVVAAAQDLLGQLARQDVPGPPEQVDGDDGPPAHGVDVGERVGGRDAAPVVGAVDHRGEEVGGGEDGQPVLHPDRSRVVAVVEPDDEAGGVEPGEPPDHLLELAGRDLARASAAVCVLGEAVSVRRGHAATVCRVRANGMGCVRRPRQSAPVRARRPVRAPSAPRRGLALPRVSVRLRLAAEVSGFLVVPPVFKTGEAEYLGLAGSIPVHLRHTSTGDRR